MNNKYDYTNPVSRDVPRIVENNRRLIQSEAKYTPPVDPDILNSMPIPTDPISMQEARNIAYNAFRIQCERNCTPGYKSQYKSNHSSSNSEHSNNVGYTGDHPTLVAFLMGCIPFAILLFFHILGSMA